MFCRYTVCPYRVGALVSPSIATPMTTVSEIDEVYVYFSMTEKELLAMTKSGSTIKEEISKIPTIKLQLIDGSTYDIEGKVDAITGVIDQSTGSVSIRAIFPNKEHVLRSGAATSLKGMRAFWEIISRICLSRLSILSIIINCNFLLLSNSKQI